MENWGCICFDLDNTLLDYEKAFQGGMLYTYKYFFSTESMAAEKWFPIFKGYCDRLYREVEEKKCTRADYKRNRFIFSMKDIGIKVNASIADEFHKHFYENVYQFVSILDGVEEFLEELQQRGIIIGLITNGECNIQNRKITRLGIDQYISPDNIFISGDCGCEKPDIEIFEIAKNQLCGETEKMMLYVGDSWELDVVGAIDAGWDAIYLNTRKKQPTSGHNPLAICSTFAEVRNIIKQH